MGVQAARVRTYRLCACSCLCAHENVGGDEYAHARIQASVRERIKRRGDSDKGERIACAYG